MKHLLAKNSVLTIFLLFFVGFASYAQQPNPKIDSLEKWVANNLKSDTVWIKSLIELERLYYIQQPSKIGTYATEILNTSKKLSFKNGILRGYSVLTYQYIQNGKYDDAIKTVFEKIKYAEMYNNNFEKAGSYSLLGHINSLMGNYEESIKYYILAKEYIEKLPPTYPKRTRTLIGYISNLYSTRIFL